MLSPTVRRDFVVTPASFGSIKDAFELETP
jgi:hypothetical protein